MITRAAIGAAAATALGACATADPIPMHRDTGAYTCQDSSLQQFVGQPATQEVGAQMLRASGARTVRWVRPGMAVTMEFSPERLTVHLDEAGRVQSASCG